jgi:hypothetical protein
MGFNKRIGDGEIPLGALLSDWSQNKRGCGDEVLDQILAPSKRVRNHSRHYPANGVCRKWIGQ